MKLLSLISLGSIGILAACAAPAGSDSITSTSHLDTSNATCTDANKAEVLAHMASAPIQPPRFAAGLDLAGADDWSGVKQATVEGQLCAGTADGQDVGTDGAEGTNYFDFGGTSDIPAVQIGFGATSTKLSYIQFSASYTGGVDFKSRTNGTYGAHTYSFHTNAAMQRDGQAWIVDWTNNDLVGQMASEIEDGLLATFAPDIDPVTSDCRVSARCLARVIPGDDTNPPTGILGARDVGFYLYFGSTVATDPVPGIPAMFYMFPHPARVTVPPPAPPPPPTPSNGSSSGTSNAH
jgi:hypothetical protein